MAGAKATGGDDPFAHTRMTLGEHIHELRKRLVRGVVAVAVLFIGALIFQDPVTAVVFWPYARTVDRLNAQIEERARERQAGDVAPGQAEPRSDSDEEVIERRLMVLGPTEGIWFIFKVCGYFAVFVGSPFLLWQLWQFVSAGLYAKEKRWVLAFFPPALLLFLLGVLFSYFVIAPFGLYYLLDTLPEFTKSAVTLEHYFSFVSTLSFGMGLVFQLPILMTFLGTVGIVEAGTFSSLRRYFVIAAFCISAFLTPGPDMFSQVAMAVPMLILFEVGILGARFGGRRRRSEPVAAEAGRP